MAVTHRGVPRRLRLKVAMLITLDSCLANPRFVFEVQDRSQFLPATDSDALNHDPSKGSGSQQ